jgi:cysteinyl-tRNA synthetase
VLRLFDTALGSVQELSVRDPGRVSLYVCGSTVDNEPHIGHGRFALVWDVLRRYLTWSGLSVYYVSNITDIDDKIINRAASEGRTWSEVAQHYEKMWWQAMDRLEVEHPDAEPHATAYVEGMVALIQQLVDRGRAYPTASGVYLAVDTIDGYGLLARQPLSSLRAGARVAVDEEQGKRSPLDFALWKAAKPGEPSWDSPWGPGRPGWHTECVVMALDLLGDDFDLHGGGIDLAFPHHENERAQAVGVGRRFARRWAHSGMVVVEGGEKMSKSLNNFVTLGELLEHNDPRAYRLLVLQSHYRSPMTVTPPVLAAAAGGVERLDAFARRFSGPAAAAEPDQGALTRFRDRMDDDLDTPGALAVVFDTVSAAHSAADAGRPEAAPLAAAVFSMAAAVGLSLGRPEAEVDPEAQALAAERDQARQARDWSRADQLRARLVELGWVVEDGPEGTILRRP